jgi:hypothetical protein
MADNVRRYTYTAGTDNLGGQDVVNLDPFARMYYFATACVDVLQGTLAGQLEVTFDDVTTLTPNSARWLPYLSPLLLTASNPPSTEYLGVLIPAPGATLPPSASTSFITVTDMVTACRLRIDRYNGTVNFTVVQGIAR